jgi:hypothetical protein
MVEHVMLQETWLFITVLVTVNMVYTFFVTNILVIITALVILSRQCNIS